MGIKGLTKLIQQYATDSYRENDIKSYFGRIIAIDATMALYQFLVESPNLSHFLAPSLFATNH